VLVRQATWSVLADAPSERWTDPCSPLPRSVPRTRTELAVSHHAKLPTHCAASALVTCQPFRGPFFRSCGLASLTVRRRPSNCWLVYFGYAQGRTQVEQTRREPNW